MKKMKVVQANARKSVGKGAAKALRREGRLPAVIYDRSGESILIDIDNHDFQLLYRSITKSTLVTITLGKEEHIAFIKDAQYDILSDSIKHVDFYQVEAGKLLRARIVLRLVGSPEGLRQGATLEMSTTEIEVECLPKDLPERLDVDVSDLEINQTLHVSELEIPEGVTVLTAEDIDIVTLKPERVVEETEEETDEEGLEEGEEGAEEGGEEEASEEA